MEQKKTKLDYFIDTYSAYGLIKESKEVVASHAQYLAASAKLKAAIAKHLQAYLAETFAGIKFQFALPCHAYVKRAHVAPNFADKVATLADIKAKKAKTLTTRKAKLASEYRNKSATSVAGGLVLKINGILNAFEKMCANLTFKPQRAFFDTLADVRTTLTAYEYGKRETWDNFVMPDSQLMRSVQSTPVVEWLLKSGYTVERCFTTLAKFEKSSLADKVAEFDSLINKLETSLCKRLHEDLNGALLNKASEEPAPNWLDTVDIHHVVRGEYVTTEIGSESTPVEMLNSREETARELAETDLRLSYSLESEECRKGIFGCVKAMTKAFEEGLANADDKASFMVSFFALNRGLYLQAFLDRAIASAVKGKGSADKKHLSDLNSLLASYSVVATPNNGESRIVGTMGASEMVHYVKFCCPWLTYKSNDGGWHESAKWAGLGTVHKGNGFPVVSGEAVCLYPPITLARYLTVKKTIQMQVRITNRARKRHNESLNKTK